MKDLVTAIGLVLVFEGLVYGGFPTLAKKLAQEAAITPERLLRIGGLSAMVVGVLIVWFARG
ncbi:DUF2065 domain-containing protein [Limoniibacter endophyticus]|uniref:DUF2065 domain-containing protein n=1 Tax=Limoniibacter endophyticus TaxID=1565040 RepID=A0A8J3DPZ3_9HYPH|nr:DUF2065 family protein [Limoniibacter endophyticus]GHC75371.1 hypothetical protein GCM10010136_25150 [Limoniibacter endophyticus]